MYYESSGYGADAIVSSPSTNSNSQNPADRVEFERNVSLTDDFNGRNWNSVHLVDHVHIEHRKMEYYVNGEKVGIIKQ